MTPLDPLKQITLTHSQAEELWKRVQKLHSVIELLDEDFFVSPAIATDVEALEHLVKDITKPLIRKPEEVPM